MLEYPILLIFPAAMIFAAVMDLLTLTIPNRISIVLVAGFLIAAPLAGLSLNTFLLHLATGGAVLLVGIVMFAMGWFGGGDAKLLAAASLWLGLEHLLPYVFGVAICGGVLALALLLYRRLLPMPLLSFPAWAKRLHDKDCGIPYGIALAAAAIWVYPHTKWFAALAG